MFKTAMKSGDHCRTRVDFEANYQVSGLKNTFVRLPPDKQKKPPKLENFVEKHKHCSIELSGSPQRCDAFRFEPAEVIVINFHCGLLTDEISLFSSQIITDILLSMPDN